MSYIEKKRARYNRAVGIAQYIVEENAAIKKVKEEFNISKETIEKDLDFLKHCPLGDEKENKQLYDEAKKQLRKNHGRIREGQ